MTEAPMNIDFGSKDMPNNDFEDGRSVAVKKSSHIPESYQDDKNNKSSTPR